MSAKRVIKATMEVVERQHEKMTFVKEDLQKELEKLSPGKTIGVKGNQEAVRLSYVVAGTAYLRKAIRLYQLALETYENKRSD